MVRFETIGFVLFGWSGLDRLADFFTSAQFQFKQFLLKLKCNNLGFFIRLLPRRNVHSSKGYIDQSTADNSGKNSFFGSFVEVPYFTICSKMMFLIFMKQVIM